MFHVTGSTYDRSLAVADSRMGQQRRDFTHQQLPELFADVEQLRKVRNILSREQICYHGYACDAGDRVIAALARFGKNGFFCDDEFTDFHDKPYW